MNTEGPEPTRERDNDAPSADTSNGREERRDQAQEYADRASDPSGDIASGGGEHPA